MEAAAGNLGGGKSRSAMQAKMQNCARRRRAAAKQARNLQEARQVERLSASFWEELTRCAQELTGIDGRVIITNEKTQKTQRKRKNI